ncbi:MULTISPECIES: hypothetical protein [unclassified Mammaliicoccus]|uniref:hypothetical protein n=1 Tax=unclassified Mammaliicoccus TaxID=2803851 RepID=UPI001EFC00FD|nr:MULTISPECIES: hypothetical protein [unclassified Mammaliicoccus]
MKKLIKPVLIVIVAILLITLITIIYFRSTEQLMDKNHAKTLVSERYKGELIKLTQSKDDRMFYVVIKDKDKKYSLEIDRKDETIKNVTSQSISKQVAKKQKPKKEKEKQTFITEKRAKQIVMNEVGGTFVDIKKNEKSKPATYTVTQHVDHDEGAMVSVNALNGKVNSVSWFNIERPQTDYNEENAKKEQYYYEDDDDYDNDDYEDD